MAYSTDQWEETLDLFRAQTKSWEDGVEHVPAPRVRPWHPAYGDGPWPGARLVTVCAFGFPAVALGEMVGWSHGWQDWLGTGDAGEPVALSVRYDRDDWVWWAHERGWRFEVVEPFKWEMRRA